MESSSSASAPASPTAVSAPIAKGGTATGAAAPAVPDQQQAITYNHPDLGPVTISIAYPSGESMFAPTVRATVDATGETVYEWSGDDGRSIFAFAGTTLNPDIENPVDGRGHIFFEWDPGRLPGVSYLVPTATGFESNGTLTYSFYDGFYDALIVDTDGDGNYEIDKKFWICDPSCAGGYGFDYLWTWDGSTYSGSDIDPRTGKSVSEEAGDPAVLAAAKERFTDYLVRAGARDYETAWAMLEPQYQDEYNGFSGFTSFWDGIDSVGIDKLTATGLDGTTFLEAVLWYQRTDGTRTLELVYVSMVDGDPPMIGSYNSIDELN